MNKHGFAIDQIINEELTLPSSKTAVSANDVEISRTDGFVALVIEAAEDITLTTETIDVIMGDGTAYDFPITRINGSTNAKVAYLEGDIMAFIPIPSILKPSLRKIKLKLDVSASINKDVNIYTVLI